MGWGLLALFTVFISVVFGQILSPPGSGLTPCEKMQDRQGLVQQPSLVEKGASVRLVLAPRRLLQRPQLLTRWAAPTLVPPTVPHARRRESITSAVGTY